MSRWTVTDASGLLCENRSGILLLSLWVISFTVGHFGPPVYIFAFIKDIVFTVLITGAIVLDYQRTWNQCTCRASYFLNSGELQGVQSVPCLPSGQTRYDWIIATTLIVVLETAVMLGICWYYVDEICVFLQLDGRNSRVLRGLHWMTGRSYGKLAMSKLVSEVLSELGYGQSRRRDGGSG